VVQKVHYLNKNQSNYKPIYLVVRLLNLNTSRVVDEVGNKVVVQFVAIIAVAVSQLILVSEIDQIMIYGSVFSI